MSHRRCASCAAILVGLASLIAAGCGRKSASLGVPPELTGLAVVPASAEVVLGVEPAKLVDAPVIDRAVDQLLLRESTLAERWRQFRDDCKIDLVKQVRRMLLAVGPSRGAGATPPGTGPVLLVVVGALPEAELKACVTRLVGSGGGTVTGKEVAGRTLYLAKDGNHVMYFAYGRPDTVVLGSDEAYVTEALGSGKKAPDNPDLASWFQTVNQNSPVWAVGRVNPRVQAGLVELTEGKISAGPTAIMFTADLADGVDLKLRAVMTTADQAKNLESYVKGLLALATAAAQVKSLGPVVSKVSVAAEDKILQLHLALSVNDVNLLLSALDAANRPAQDRAPPQPTAGSGAQ
jgi:hypothetical protein